MTFNRFFFVAVLYLSINSVYSRPNSIVQYSMLYMLGIGKGSENCIDLKLLHLPIHFYKKVTQCSRCCYYYYQYWKWYIDSIDTNLFCIFCLFIILFVLNFHVFFLLFSLLFGCCCCCQRWCDLECLAFFLFIFVVVVVMCCFA